MAKYNGNIGNILQGVSQQARRDRRPEQLSIQDNCYSSISNGTGKRPGATQFGEDMALPNFLPAAKHTYDRGDGSERYTIGAGLQGYSVTDLLTGEPALQYILEPTAFNYLQDFSGEGKDMDKCIKFFTIADTTFVVNNTAVVTMSDPATKPEFQAILYLSSANYGFEYSIVIDGVVIASHSTPATVTLAVSTETQDVNKTITLKTSDVMTALRVGGLDTWAASHGVTLTASDDDSVIVLTKATSVDILIEAFDDNNNNDLRVIGISYGKYDEMPPKCLGGVKVKISGVDTSADNDYYVEFVRDNDDAGVGKGVWKECIGFDMDQILDPATMPHKITRDATNHFQLNTIDWIKRVAGNDNTNPKPSFVGNTINGIALYQDRLVFLTAENVVASTTFDHFNLFSASVITSSADDPIDTSSSDNTVTNLEYMLVFDGSLMVFSNKAQFVHPRDTAFTSALFALSSKSQYSIDIISPPVASATSVFFPYNFGKYTGIREYRTDPITGVTDANSITRHVEEYIEGKCLQIMSSTDYNLLMVRADEAPNTIYVYQWYDRDGTRQQAAWHRWVFDKHIQHMDIIQDTLYAWYEQDGGLKAYYTIDLADRDTQDITYPIRLDALKLQTATDAGTYWWIARPLTAFGLTAWDDVRVIAGDGTGVPGALVPWTIGDNDTGIKVFKTDVPDATTPEFYTGKTYLSVIEITNPYVRDSSGKPKSHARTTLKTMKFNCFRTGYIKARVTKDFAGEYVKEASSRIIGSAAYLLNYAEPLLDLELDIPIRTDAAACQIRLESASHLPFSVSDIDWSCKYNEKGRRTV